MMTNLFSIFDPSLSMFSFSWYMIFVSLLFLPGAYWVLGYTYCLFYNFLSLVSLEVTDIYPRFIKGVYSFIGSIFLLVFMINFLALFPFLFSMTSHLLVTLPMSFSFWFGIIIFTWVSSFKDFLVHLIPSGTPLALISFMVLVELLSNFIRPLALTFRLTANMMAGHLLMSLVGGFLINSSTFIMVTGSLVQFMLVTMELGVSIIQAYVFSVLLLLYLSESSH